MTKYISRHEKLLGQVMQQNNDLSYQNGTIASSWQLSILEIRRRNTSAVGLLQLWSFMDNSDLWWELLNTALECPKKRVSSRSLPNLTTICSDVLPYSMGNVGTTWLQELAEDEIIFLEAMRVLLEFSFVRKNIDSQSYSIHPLVHEWIRSTIHASLWESYINAAASVLGRSVPLAHHTGAWVLARRLTPHVDRFWKLLDSQDALQYTSADGFDGLAIYEFDRCRYGQAKRSWEIGCECWVKQAGLENPLTIQCFLDCALAYRALGELEKAEARWRWVYEQCNRVEQEFLINDTVLTEVKLRALDDLGRLYFIQRRYDDAIDYLAQALSGKQKALGPEDPLTLDTERQLGLALYKQGRITEAKQLHMKVVAGFEKVCGHDNIWTLLAKSDLGAIHHHLGKLDEAKTLLKESLTLMESQVGPTNEKSKEIGMNLAALYQTQGRVEKATEISNLYASDGSRS